MPRHALIVEPDAARAAQYADLLERRGFAPAVAQRGDEAIFLAARARHLALIVVDASLPDMDGLGALRELRRKVPPRDCAAIVLVGSRAAYELAARSMIPLGIAALLPSSHSVARLTHAIDRIQSGKSAADDVSAREEDLPSDPPEDVTDAIPEHLASHPLVQHLARQRGLGACADEDMQRVATATARAFGAAVALLWIDLGGRSAFKLHLEDMVPAGSPLRVPERWRPIRGLIGSEPVYVADVSDHEAFAASPLLPQRAAATLMGVPLRAGTQTVGAVAVVQPHVVGRLGRGLLEPLVFWGRRLSGDLLGLNLFAAARPARPPPASRSAAVPPAQALESIAAVLDVALLGSDDAGVVCYANAAMLALLGAERRQILGQRRAVALRRLASAAGAEDGVVSAIVGSAASASSSDFTVQNPQRCVVRWRARPLPLGDDTAGTLDEFTNVTREFERARARDLLVRVDAATQLPNRAGLDDALGREVARSLRTGEPFSIALFALDHPHRADGGDEVFRSVAWLLRSTARRHDLVGRLDQLRLMAVMSGTTPDQALAFCERFAGEVRRLDVDGRRTTVSAGVAQFDAGKGIRDVIDEATGRLSEARRLGGDRAMAGITRNAG